MMTAIAFPAKMTLVHARALLMAVTKSQNWQAGSVIFSYFESNMLPSSRNFS